jgi:putative FmdB family regulatory protein
MPAYDYDCAACGRRFEVIHGVHVEGPTSCPLCGKGPVRKAITAAAIHYKGSGWAKKERRSTATAASSKASSDGTSHEGGSSSDSGPSDSASSTGKKTDGASKDGASKGGATSDSGSSASSD